LFSFDNVDVAGVGNSKIKADFYGKYGNEAFHKRKGAYALFKKRFKAALGCMAIRTQTELMIRRVQFIRRTKEAATQASMRWKYQRIPFRI